MDILNNKNKLLTRDISENHRVATTLELLYDLIFVVAIANLAAAFHHDFAHNHIQHGAINFVMIFVTIWWAWGQYTWFASSFDNNSVRYRLATLWQMVGALVLAAGVEDAGNGDFSVIVIGYVIIRSSSILLWLKVSFDNPKLKITARRYAVGILLCQIGWITHSLGEFSYFIFAGLLLAEMLVPFIAESHTQTNYHPEHVEERHGLLTIIVLGESILAAAYSLSALVEKFSWLLLSVSVGCLLTLFGIWWIYFSNKVEHLLRSKHFAFQWGYAHFFIFAAAAAIGALISVNVDVLAHQAHIDIALANLGFAISVSICLLGIWFCHDRVLAQSRVQFFSLPIALILIIVLGLLPHSIMSIGVLITAFAIFRQYRPLRDN